jgi:hypothetical protein
MITVTAELLKSYQIGSIKCWQEQSLNVDELLDYFRNESNEKIIPTYPNERFQKLYQELFLDTDQYVCLKQGKKIHAFWSWLFLASEEDAYKVPSDKFPVQDKITKIIWLAPVCISKIYRGKVNWMKNLNEFLPDYDLLTSERNGILRIVNKKDNSLKLINL